eukprot:CAMPEP_0198131394 /NCGR_PEP_ID=MMETSP1442-20131203/56087_1 /TAXON_ID= /ORGANISM="Craspedostauros australis, Strain CCMP3328" /LENGTH=50 /DNA_ID=CAMNT_0043792195 /DNA_START=83 /DNA_END=235 /DNA_ORIENTATION=+
MDHAATQRSMATAISVAGAFQVDMSSDDTMDTGDADAEPDANLHKAYGCN